MNLIISQLLFIDLYQSLKELSKHILEKKNSKKSLTNDKIKEVLKAIYR